MSTFHFDLVSPEKLLFSGEVDQVDVPGIEGEFGVLAGVIKDTEEDVADSSDDWQRDKLTRKLEQLKALQAALAP